MTKKQQQLGFYPPLLGSPLWDDIEVQPVQIIGYSNVNEKAICEVCEEKDASFWSVYLRLITGGVVCIADVPSKKLAEDLAALISFIKYSENL